MEKRGRGRPAAGSFNKSQAIRDWFKANENASNKDCIIALAKKDIELSPALVQGVRNRMMGKTPKRKGEVTVDEIKTLKDFVSKSNLDSEVASNILGEFVSVVEEIGNLARFKEVLTAFDSYEDEDEDEDVTASSEEEDEDEDEDVTASSEEEDEDEDEDVTASSEEEDEDEEETVSVSADSSEEFYYDDDDDEDDDD